MSDIHIGYNAAFNSWAIDGFIFNNYIGQFDFAISRRIYNSDAKNTAIQARSILRLSSYTT